LGKPACAGVTAAAGHPPPVRLPLENAMERLQEDEATAAAEGAPPLETQGVPAAEVAQYVERMCAELAILSERTGLGFLAYLLEVAREEARLHAPRAETPTVHGELPPR
jgi:hypothetical protein